MKLTSSQFKAIAAVLGAVCALVAAFVPTLAPAMVGLANVIGLAAPALFNGDKATQR